MPVSGSDFVMQGKQKLDPKLHRLVYAVGEPAMLPSDISRAFLTAAPDFDPSVPEASKLSKRVLVKLRGSEIPAAFVALQWSHIVDEIYTVTVPLTRLAELGASDAVEFVSAGNFLGPTLDTSLNEVRADAVHTGSGVTSRTGAGVVVGIIDFGFDFTLADFRSSSGTRVAFFWNQGLTPQPGERSPLDFPYGVEYTAQDIDKAIVSPDPFAVVRHHDPGELPLGPAEHGTHVAGIAVGNGTAGDATFPAGAFVGVAPEATIIFVQPDAADADSSFTDSVHVADAIRYIFEKATQMGRPCVINMSLGQNGGSHDGESIVERAIDRLLEIEPGRAMVVAAGNEHVWRGHASGHVATGQTRTLHWKVGGQMPIPGGGATGSGIDRTPNELEIWYSSRNRFRVHVTDPLGEDTAVVNPGETKVFRLSSGDTVFIDSVRFSPFNGDSQIYIEVLPKPGPTPFSFPRITAGVWEITLEALESRDGRFDAWIERDARIGNNNFADQSFFVGSDFDPVMTLGTPATNRRAIAVANYSHVTQDVNSSSSRGLTRDGRLKPEVAAPGTNIVSSNALGGRIRPGQSGPVPVRTAMSGTSMSAPHVAGIVALMLEAHPTLTAPQMTKILTATARPPVPAGTPAFDIAFGFGRVDALEAVRLAAEIAP